MIILAISIAFMIMTYLLFGKNQPSEIDNPQLKDKVGEVIEKIVGKEKKGKVIIAGEIWWAKTRSKATLLPGEKNVPVDMEGLTLIVEKANKISEETK